MKIARVVTILLVIGLFVGAAGKETNGKSIEVNILPGLLEEVEKSRPKEVMVYEILPSAPALTMKKSMQLLEIKGKYTEKGNLLVGKEGNRYLEVRKVSNTIFYADMARLWREEPSPSKTKLNILGDEETKKIAQEWLRKLGFSPEDLKNSQISVTDEIFELTLPDKKERPIKVTVGKNVEVRRRLDNLLIYGPGSKIKIYVGEGGKVNGFMAVWRQIRPGSAVLGHQPLKGEPKGQKVVPLGAKEAFAVLKENPLDRIPLALVYKIEVDKVAFGYFSRSAAEQQKHLQPVYVFSGIAYAKLPKGQEVKVPYEQYVLALKKPLEPIWPETRDIKPTPRRKVEVPVREKDVDEKVGK